MVAVFGCFTMQSVLWPTAPIIGGWAVFFQLENTYLTVSTVLTVGTIRIQSIFSNQIIFVFVFGRLFKTE